MPNWPKTTQNETQTDQSTILKTSHNNLIWDPNWPKTTQNKPTLSKMSENKPKRPKWGPKRAKAIQRETQDDTKTSHNNTQNNQKQTKLIHSKTKQAKPSQNIHFDPERTKTSQYESHLHNTTRSKIQTDLKQAKLTQNNPK